MSNAKKARTASNATVEKTQTAAANFAGGEDREELPRPQQVIKDKLPVLTGPQKAAAVIVSLGADKASQIYKFRVSTSSESMNL